MKTKIFSTIVLGALLSSTFMSCENDILEQTNPNEPTTGAFYKTPEDAEQAIIAAYSALQFFGVYNRYWVYTQSGRSDESVFTPKQSGLPEVSGLDDFTVTATNTAVHETWRDNYMGVLKSNVVLAQVPTIVFSDEKQKNRILGEAHFLRALYHFNLINNFGEEIPVYDYVPSSGNDFFAKSAEKGVAYKLIVEDLIEAQKLLPKVEEYRGTKNIGRITQGAATAYLGKVYLFQKQYQKAADEFAKIIDGSCGKYELMSQFRDNFEESNENNNESLFEVQYNISAGDVWNITYENEKSSEANIIEQEATNVDGISGLWWNQKPSSEIIAEFEVSDPRYYKTFWCPNRNGASTLDNSDPYTIDGKAYTYEQYAGSRVGSFGWRKWSADVSTASWESGINVRLMRLADVYLMHAECIIGGASDKNGKTAEQYINMVRDRARNIPDASKYGLVGSLPTVEQLLASKPVINGRKLDNLTNILRHERMVELAYEGKRWEDIVRWGIGNDIFPNIYKPWLPIYQADLDANPNLKPNSSN